MNQNEEQMSALIKHKRSALLLRRSPHSRTALWCGAEQGEKRGTALWCGAEQGKQRRTALWCGAEQGEMARNRTPVRW
ncbi:MAG: hypothetical protein IJI41_04475 [Anaerolineaceae bacterium]|nr:hypothetical protein [Anaerolineaceae bacterium]